MNQLHCTITLPHRITDADLAEAAQFLASKVHGKLASVVVDAEIERPTWWQRFVNGITGGELRDCRELAGASNAHAL